MVTPLIWVGGRAALLVVPEPATHAGCLVDSISDRKINCPCHPGVFRIDDGVPVSGPPKRPLAPAVVSVQGDQLYLHV